MSLSYCLKHPLFLPLPSTLHSTGEEPRSSLMRNRAGTSILGAPSKEHRTKKPPPTGRIQERKDPESE
ncbi:hypothetical protein CapIbe_019987 [Capra ibex]